MKNHNIRNVQSYFASDLNEFVHNNCSKEMVVNNIDMVQLKKFEDTVIIRITETKRGYEKWDITQEYLLKTLARCFKYMNKVDFNYSRKQVLKFELYRASGDSPYFDLKVENMITGQETKLVGVNEVISFLNLEESP